VSQNNIELEISKNNFCLLFSSSKFSFPWKQAIKARWTVELSAPRSAVMALL